MLHSNVTTMINFSLYLSLCLSFLLLWLLFSFFVFNNICNPLFYIFRFGASRNAAPTIVAQPYWKMRIPSFYLTNLSSERSLLFSNMWADPLVLKLEPDEGAKDRLRAISEYDCGPVKFARLDGQRIRHSCFREMHSFVLFLLFKISGQDYGCVYVEECCCWNMVDMFIVFCHHLFCFIVRLKSEFCFFKFLLNSCCCNNNTGNVYIKNAVLLEFSCFY